MKMVSWEVVEGIFNSQSLVSAALIMLIVIVIIQESWLRITILICQDVSMFNGRNITKFWRLSVDNFVHL